jgi:hypothetical protein
MREAYDRTGSTEEAVVEGIGRTGRLVALLGRCNWWLPRRPARLLRVEPSCAVPEVV